MRAIDATLASLKRAGVNAIFGMPGGPVIPLFDALHDDPDIRTFLVRHEQGAGHMAEGYAKATGRAGVCTATSGPGATNLVTPIADAYMDSVPLLAITGQVGATRVGTDAFQEADIVGITLPIVKHSYLIKDADDLPARAHRGPARGPDRPPGPGAGRRLRRPVGARCRATSRARAATCPATGRRPAPATRARSRPPPRALAVRRAAGHLRRRRDHQRRGLGRAHPPVGGHRHPGQHHPDGPRRLPGHATRCSSGCPACTASPPRPTPSRPRTRSWPSACASTSGCSPRS